MSEVFFPKSNLQNLIVMVYMNFIGIDISKLSLDFCLCKSGGEPVYFRCTNSREEIGKCLEKCFVQHGLSTGDTLLCAEHTGMYGNLLKGTCLLAGYQLWVEHPYNIRRSSGEVHRGKDDRRDSERIMSYARRFSDRATACHATDEVLGRLAYLASERELLVCDRAKYMTQIAEEKPFHDSLSHQRKSDRYGKIVSQMEEAILGIEAEMDELVESDSGLKAQYDSMVSIDGIGRHTALKTLIATEGFSRFTDPRKFCCHAGCAPFKYQSGTSIRSKNKVSHRADKGIKRLFHMAALSAIRMEGELRDYYLRKVAEGKNKMSVINAVRAKLIARVFAVVLQGRKYKKNYTIPIA